MEEQESSFQNALLGFAKKNFLVLGLLGVGLVFLGIGAMQILGTHKTQIKFEKSAEVAGVESSSSAKIKIDVEGQVINPGVYSLNTDARIQDALIAAGGMSSQADRKQINLAAKVADGQKIYVPAQGEAMPAGSSMISSSGSTAQNPNGPVSINSATESELDSLPSVGPVTAQKIINGRPYAVLQDLVSKKILGQKTYDKIKDMISL